MDWKEYETQIFEKFCSEFPNSNVLINQSIPGKYSLVSRQVDILIKSDMIGYELLGVVECKYFSKKVDVKIIESFIGFLEDVGANLGVIITNKGFTKAAQNRASIKGIKLDIVNYEDLEQYHYEPELCKICDHPFPVIDFNKVQSYVDSVGKQELVEIGHCEQCNSLHIKCCGIITPVWESQYGDEVECDGGCSNKFVVTYEYDSSHILYENVEVKFN